MSLFWLHKLNFSRITISHRFISSLVSKTQMSVNPKDASSKGWTERHRKHKVFMKTEGERWRNGKMRAERYAMPNEAWRWTTFYSVWTWKIPFQYDKLVLTRSILYARNPTKSAVICSKWNINTRFWSPLSPSHDIVLWIVPLLMYVKYFTAKSDPKCERHKNDPGMFSELTEEKQFTSKFHICFKWFTDWLIQHCQSTKPVVPLSQVSTLVFAIIYNTTLSQIL